MEAAEGSTEEEARDLIAATSKEEEGAAVMCVHLMAMCIVVWW